jgi:long-chain acyl-CoA synthetase
MNGAALLVKTAAQHPEAVAVRHGEKLLTYAQLAERAGRLGHALLDLGLEPGDRIALMQRNGLPLVESLYGCLMAGFVVVPINVRLHPREVAFITSDAGCRALLHSSDLNEELAAVESEFTLGLLRISDRPTMGELDYEDLIARAEPLAGPVDRRPDDVSWLFYTSGTTGRPKGVMWTHRTLVNLAVDYLADIYPMTDEDVVLHAAPMTHGSGTVMLAAVARGAENLILNTVSFDPDAVFELIEHRRVTNIAFLAPTQVVKLLDSFATQTHDLSSLRCLLYGGAPMYLDQLRRALEAFGPVLVQILGQGESPMTISHLSREDHLRLWTGGDARLGSAGVARTSVEVRVVDGDDEPVATGATGEIVVRGDIVMAGYWANEEATAEALRGGWLHTGDVGSIDEGGYLYVLDRSKEMVITGGNNVYPREVEEVLLTHPAVQECAVIGVPDAYWGESVHAVVVLRPGTIATADELRAHCASSLASYKKPRTLEFLESLPKNAYGKVLKRELREPRWIGYERRVGGGSTSTAGGQELHA